VRHAGLCLALGLAVALLCACGEEFRDEPRGAPASDAREIGALDPQPEKLNGSESLEFDRKDLEAARDAGRLIELYCESASSEAQYEGCLSHVVEEDVCSQNTAAKREAVVAYVDETGDDAICD